MTLRALGDDNARGGDHRFDPPSRRETFSGAECRRATYREILERRAKENSVDFVEGVATAITPMAVLETVMVKGYQTVVDPDTTVDVKTGMLAACRLQELIDSRADQADRARMQAEMGRIVEVVRTFIPSERWPEVQAALRGEGLYGHSRLRAVEGIRMVDIDDMPDEDDY